MKHLTLAMIVKNEVDNVAVALDSAKSFVDSVVVLDTGSTDGTQDVIDEWCSRNRIKLLLIDEPFTDFATARTRVLALAREVSRRVGFTLMLDADDRLDEMGPIDAMPQADAYTAQVRLGNVVYERVCVFSNTKDWRYRGVVHEFPDLEGSRIGGLVGSIEAGTHGARSRDPLKYLHDAEAINNALAVEPDQMLRNRYCFYLAQSYRDARHAGAAIYWYEVVSKLTDNWSEERYIACLNLGRLTSSQEWFWKAIGINKLRAEAWRALGIDQVAGECKLQPHWLFVERAAYADDQRR